jgi:HK97 family phage major capsid protein
MNAHTPQDADLSALLNEIKDARAAMATADTTRIETFAELKKDIASGSKSVGETTAKLERVSTDMAELGTRIQSLETSIDAVSKKMGRPNGGLSDMDEVERKSAINYMQERHYWKVPKVDSAHPFAPSEDGITEAAVARKAFSAVLKCSDLSGLPDVQRKALTGFSVGSSQFIMPIEVSNRVLSCMDDESDITGFMDSIQISSSGVKFFVDNSRLDVAAWACQSDCFANNPTADLANGLGELEIRPEELRYVICASRDILDDAAIDMEAFMINKINQAFKRTINNAVLVGTGVGMPIGILNPNSGIQVCDTAGSTPPGQFSWQDLIALKWSVNSQYHARGRYTMNQTSFALTLTMTDAIGRPIMISTPQDSGSYIINGSPISIVTQMPDPVPGATPVMFADFKSLYLLVYRRAVTMQQDPYSAGFCVLYKFSARVGGGIICPNAGKLLRIR